MQSWNWPAIRKCAQLIRNPQILRPKLSYKNLRDVDWKHIKEQYGIRAVCFDKDNTLTAPYSQSLHFSVIKSVEICTDVFEGRTAIFSNSIGSSQFDPEFKKADSFTKSTGINVIKHNSKKPDGVKEIFDHFHNLDPGYIAFVGDRLLTDIVMANEAGLFSIYLTEPISLQGDNIPAIAARFIEKKILYYLHFNK